MFDTEALHHALDLISDSSKVIDEVDRVTMQRLEYTKKPPAEQLENDERWWEVYTAVMSEFIHAITGVNEGKA